MIFSQLFADCNEEAKTVFLANGAFQYQIRDEINWSYSYERVIIIIDEIP